ncbi:MAG: fused MFS/spermidine synthase, partial [Planctomycetota bacterium]
MTPLHLLLFASGVAGLGYQVVWTRWFGFGLGHEMAGVTGVVGAFFGGLAAGAWLLDGPIARSRRPGLWYVGLEVLIGVWALCALLLIPGVDEFAAARLGPEPGALWHAAVATAVPAVLLAPATVAMGATLPAMERFARAGRPGSAVGGLYAANTAGAMLGTLGATFFLLPALGFEATAVTLAVLNLACAGAALLLGARGSAAAEDPEDPSGARDEDGAGAPVSDGPDTDGHGTDGHGTDAPRLTPRRIGATLAATGLLGIAYETVGIRMLTQVLENTVFTFTMALSVYLGGTAAGAALYQRMRGRTRPERALGPLLVLLSALSLASVGAMSSARDLHASVADEQGFARALLGEWLLAALLFLLPTLAMGATFACLADAWQRAGRGLGRALALNTLGSAAAPSLAGWLLVPAAGLKWAALGTALAYGALAVGRTRSAAAPVVLLALAAWAGSSDLGLVDRAENERVLERRDGVLASVTVTEVGGGARVLRVDNHFRMGSTQSLFLERRLGMIPLLLHPAPARALFLGLGTGATLSAATFHPGLATEGVELVPEVLDALPRFSDVNADVYEHPAVRLVAADARRYVRASGGGYDVVVADLFQPARDGAGALYTVEHFAAVRGALAEGGLFCQWLPLYQMDDAVARTIARTFLDVFPDAQAFVGSFNPDTPALGLVGTRGALLVDPAALAARMRDQKLGPELERLALDDLFDLLGCRVADASQLAAY